MAGLLPNKRWPLDFDHLANANTGFYLYAYDGTKSGWMTLAEALILGGGGGGGGGSYNFGAGFTVAGANVSVNFGGSGSANTVAHSDHTHSIYLADSANLSDLASASAARTNLGLGNIATLNGAARGQVAYYGASGWAVLPPGTAGYVLQTNGSGADPSWASPGSGGGGAEYASPVAISGTGAQSIGLTGARTFVQLTATTGATNATLPTGTVDKQRALIVATAGTQKHTLTLNLIGATKNLSSNTPNYGWAGEFLWDANAATWYPLSMDGGLKVSDLDPVSAIALADKLELLQQVDGVSRNGTLAQILGLLLASGGQFAAMVGSSVAALTDASSITTNGNVNKGNIFTLTTGATGHALATPTNMLDGTYIYLITLGVANAAPTFWSGITWIGTGGNNTPPTFSTAAGVTDSVTIVKSGSTYYGWFAKGS